MGYIIYFFLSKIKLSKRRKKSGPQWSSMVLKGPKFDLSCTGHLYTLQPGLLWTQWPRLLQPRRHTPLLHGTSNSSRSYSKHWWTQNKNCTWYTCTQLSLML